MFKISSLSIYFVFLLICELSFISSFRFSLLHRISNQVHSYINKNLVPHPQKIHTSFKNRNVQLYSTTSNTQENNVVEDNDKVLRQIAMMISLWQNVAFPSEDEGVEMNLSDYGLTRKDIKGFLQHFQNCKDCAGNF